MKDVPVPHEYGIFMDSGLYIAVFRLTRRCRLPIGKLGTFLFPPGYYFCVGSARVGK
jgi:hypothetical protein